MTYFKTYLNKQYSCKITYVLTDDILFEIKKWYKKNKILHDELENYEGIVLYKDISHYTLILNLNYLSYNTINHELFHLTRELALPRGIQEDESQAWIMGNVSQELYNFINKKNLSIK